MAAEAVQLHLTVQHYCILCRCVIHREQDSPAVVKHRRWEFKMLCFFNLADEHDASVQIHTMRAKLERDGVLGGAKKPALVLKNLQGEARVVFIHEQMPRQKAYRGIDATKPLFYVHQCCWKAVQAQYGEISSSILYKMSLQLQPVLEESLVDTQRALDWDIFTNPGVSGESEISNALRLVYSHLPPELHLNVLQHVTDSLSYMLLSACRTARLFLGCADRGLVSARMMDNLVLEDGGKDWWLFATITYIFSQPCIHRIEITDNAEENTLKARIPVRRNALRGIGFVLGVYGLRAARLLYDDGSTSSWLGDSSMGWYGCTYGTDLNLLRVVQDDLKVIQLSFTEPCLKRSSSWPINTLWKIRSANCSVLDEPLDRDEFRIVDIGLYPGLVLHYPGWRACQYLPLYEGGIYATGLTVYCNVKAIHGIVVHGKSDHMAGTRYGSAHYFHLHAKERITFMCFSFRTYLYNGRTGPHLLIKTSYDRSAFFGPICARNDECTGWSAAVPDDQGVITGIIIDTLARHHTQILSIGTRRAGPIENSHASSPAYPISVPVSNFQRWPMFERANSTGMASHRSYAFLGGSTFVTTASLENATKLQIRRVDARVVGLCIHHKEGLVESLGQWDPSDNLGDRNVIDIYDENFENSLDSLTFHYSINLYKSTYIDDISVGSRPVGGSSFVWHAYADKYLAWWFDAYSDHVEPWDGSHSTLEITGTHCRPLKELIA